MFFLTKVIRSACTSVLLRYDRNTRRMRRRGRRRRKEKWTVNSPAEVGGALNGLTQPKRMCISIFLLHHLLLLLLILLSYGRPNCDAAVVVVTAECASPPNGENMAGGRTERWKNFWWLCIKSDGEKECRNQDDDDDEAHYCITNKILAPRTRTKGRYVIYDSFSSSSRATAARHRQFLNSLYSAAFLSLSFSLNAKGSVTLFWAEASRWQDIRPAGEKKKKKKRHRKANTHTRIPASRLYKIFSFWKFCRRRRRRVK